MDVQRTASSSRFRMPLPVLVFFVLFLPASLWVQPGRANVLPESAILVHVQPVQAGEPCATTIDQCSEVIRTTTQQGELEFLLFVYPVAYVEEHYPLFSVSALLTWPTSWQFVSWQPCGGGVGSLDVESPDHRLVLSWPDCPSISGQIFLAARIVLQVSGEGRLDFADQYNNLIWLGCHPAGFAAMAAGMYAEAGMDCGFTNYECASAEYCRPDFAGNGILITVPQGGTGQGQMQFNAISAFGPNHSCELTPWIGASWGTASIVPDEWPGFHLVVNAAAGNLEVGTYDTDAMVSWHDFVGRCLPVRLIVTAASSAPQDPVRYDYRSWGGIKARYRP